MMNRLNVNRKQKYESKFIKKSIRFTKREYEIIKKQMQKTGENFTQYVKRIVVNKRTRVPSYQKVKEQIFTELNRIGNNINQLAKLAHTHNELDILKQLYRIEQELKNIK